MVVINGEQASINNKLHELSDDTTHLSLRCDDSDPIRLSHDLLERGVHLQTLSLEHVNLVPEEIKADGTRPHARRRSVFTHRPNELTEEQKLIKEQQEIELYKIIFMEWKMLTFLELVDCSGVLTEPIHFIKSLPLSVPLLETLKISKTLRKRSTNDDLMVLDNETMGHLAKLEQLKVLSLLGFAGRQDQYNQYYYTNLENAVEIIAKRGRLEEFHFSNSGLSYRAVFCLIRHCKNLRIMKCWSRFGEPGLFMLHHNLPFLKLADHHRASAVYEPEEDSPRQVTLILTNVEMELPRYDPSWVNDTYPEERITLADLTEEDNDDE